MACLVRLFWLIVFSFQSNFLYACDGLTLEITYNGRSSVINVEIADTHVARQKGLMFRESLGMNSGMLFIYEDPRLVNFWMKNTSIPLDIAFADKKGKVVQIYKNTKPFSLDLIAGGEKIQYVLEVNAGMSEKFLLFEGAKLNYTNFKKKSSDNCS